MIQEWTYNSSTQTETLARAFINGVQYIDERAVLVDYVAGGTEDHYYLLQGITGAQPRTVTYKP